MRFVLHDWIPKSILPAIKSLSPSRLRRSTENPTGLILCFNYENRASKEHNVVDLSGAVFVGRVTVSSRSASADPHDLGIDAVF